MSFGGGGSGAAAITAHIHSTAIGEGGSLKQTGNTATGTSLDIGGNDYPIEVLM